MRFKLDENLPAALFGRDKPVVSCHLHRVFNLKLLGRESDFPL